MDDQAALDQAGLDQAGDEHAGRRTSRLRPDGVGGRNDRLAAAGSLAALAIAAISFYIEASTEPFHVDEIRQVAPYGASLRIIVDESFAQEQPPLDGLVGAVFQLILGVGDTIQRSSSVVFGLAAMGLLALLLWRRGMRTAVPITLAVLAISPAFVSYTAYARPYALPLALMLGFAYGADLWLDDGTISGGLFATVCAIALPLSRVFEPPAFLGLAIITLIVERGRWGRRVWWPIIAAGGALMAVELPVYRRLSAAFDKYADSPARSASAEWDRIIHRSIPELAHDFPWPWLTLALVVAALAIPGVRRSLGGLWWFAPLTGSAIAFAFAFHVQAAPPQTYYARYGYFFIVPVAVIVGQLVAWAVRNRQRQRMVAGLVLALASIGALASGVALVDDFGHDTNTDYRALGLTIDRELPIDTIVVYDSLDFQVGRWRPGFYGKTRYLAPGREVVEPEPLLFEPMLISGSSDVAIAINGPPLTVEGWVAFPASRDMTLYVPDQPIVDGIDVARALDRFASVAPRGSAMLRLAAASLFNAAADHGEACRQYRLAVESSPSRSDAIATIVSESTISHLPDVCA